MNFMENNLEFTISSITPVYDFTKVSGGHFLLKFGLDDTNPFKLSFVPFLEQKIREDEKLFAYLKDTVKDKTVSDAIYDLYDIGFPVDEWVMKYVDDAKNSITPDMFNALIQFYNFIKDFNDSPSGSLDV
jgi:hypothetical protein